MAVIKGGIKQSIRNHVASLVFGLAPFKRTMANLLSEVSVGYPDSPLNAKSAHLHGGPEPGQRAPIREGEPAVGSGNTPRFALFAEDTLESRSLLSKYPNLGRAFAAETVRRRGPLDRSTRRLRRPRREARRLERCRRVSQSLRESSDQRRSVDRDFIGDLNLSSVRRL